MGRGIHGGAVRMRERTAQEWARISRRHARLAITFSYVSMALAVAAIIVLSIAIF